MSSPSQLLITRKRLVYSRAGRINADCHLLQRPYTNLNIQEILIFVTYTIFNIPLNVYWQEWLEGTFPGSKPAASPAKENVGKNEKSTGTKQVTDYKNIAIKFALDQTVGAAVNITLFIAGVGALKGMGRDEILQSIKRVCFANTLLL